MTDPLAAMKAPVDLVHPLPEADSEEKYGQLLRPGNELPFLTPANF